MKIKIVAGSNVKELEDNVNGFLVPFTAIVGMQLSHTDKFYCMVVYNENSVNEIQPLTTEKMGPIKKAALQKAALVKKTAKKPAANTDTKKPA